MSRTIVRLLLSVLLGVLTSLSLAWGIAAFVPVGSGPRTPIGSFERWGRAWHITYLPGPDLSIRFWGDLAQGSRIDNASELVKAMTPPPAAELVASNHAELLEMQRTHATQFPFEICNDPPSWGTLAQSEPPPTGFVHGSDSGFGWPCPCLWYQVLTTINRFQLSTVEDRLVGGIVVRGTPSGVMPDFHALPLRPIWPGLAIDTGLFGAAWLGVLVLPGVVRRVIRIRRGRCPACGYDLSGSTAPGCSECGRGRAAVA